MRIALVSTLARAQPVIQSWVRNHRTLGVETFYLFADQPAELAHYTALDLPGVQWIARDAELEQQWRALPSWREFETYAPRQVYARQCLNADLALRWARAAGFDWLIHLDSDEQLWLPPEWPDLPAYFRSRSEDDAVRFVNHEAVPEHWHVADYFAEVSLFKKNALCLTPAQQQTVQGLFGARYFQAYGNGKSAVNLRRGATDSSGVHEFKPCPRQYFETRAALLHYPYCGYNWYLDKFSTLGWFDDFWIGSGDIAKLFPVMTEARAAVNGRDFHAATRHYDEQIMRQGGLPHSQSSLLAAGILFRIPLATVTSV